MNQMSKLDHFIQQAVSAAPVSGTSLISSLYGDSLSHRGGEIWLGSLTALLEGLGFGDRFVRTSLFRLNKEGWLDVDRIGRRSFYRLSDKGMRLTRRAESKIYRAEAPAWDGNWLLLLSEGLDRNTLADVKKQLIWQGFGTLAPNLLASPSQRLADVQALLHEAGVAEQVICFEAQSPLATSVSALRARVEECWQLTGQNQLYEDFIATFRPLLPLLREADEDELTPARCFAIQLLLIHLYRRVILKDPLLPEALLPAHWLGQSARQLCINIYRCVAPGALAWVSEKGETSVGPLPQPASSFWQRFGGLKT
ncbi:phenylacetic acid degradation operon negative regulatory protein PaaX [Pluralibacter gergoviae]|uniref:phenylacetic acid degradation operon negative regulatory protein PaaX n=1 Tax=Pluralibacter gergoviae TaxID=61647 RepID=UPI0004F7B2A3|nr:phenylacetic acid degradation operon negative regulatory protein PaaX [Pluralibacter gergoviae]AIR01633.1 phenylacetic acid degradation operon negative regulatory protein PaaX [Pluralibacter gergoviae]EKZ9514323.1 phenylacetic acid degradation operon negative regulatory protein PaaX [Pluralibacter gergoviae]ELC3016419.1 phenylacetic acid degradation operon negative regulatory protein PaaX [Pluralibacter gergoviae]ELC3021399.1 phenylacetic acid degradation operon negative regulatory protein P